MTRRSGLSLTEVLVALFIMGIGTIAILTLFPLGALNMAQALRDSRTTQAAVQADGFLRAYVEEKKSAGALPAETWFTALDNPNSPTLVSKYFVPTSGLPGPSYPVVIDPMGFVARGSVAPRATWIGDNGFGNGDRATAPDTSGLSRHTLKAASSLPNTFAQRICTLFDGMGYDKQTGAPDTSSGTIDRDIRYNWFWVLQKPSSNASPAEAKVTVVVFDRRAPMYAPAGSETVYTPTTATPGVAQVSFAAGQVPPVQKGGWLLDATVVTTNSLTNPTTFFVPSGTADADPSATVPLVRNAHFYRVVSAIENAAGGLDVELEVPLKDDTGMPPGLPAIFPQYRRFIYLNGVAEVFERSTLPL